MSDAGEQQALLSYSYDDDAENVCQETRPTATLTRYREKTAGFLESTRLHTFVITLITIDAACVLTDLGYSFLAADCTPEAEGPAWLEVLSTISLVITTLFLIEIPVALWAHGMRHFVPFSGVPRAALHLFDAVIILTTFVLEFVLKGREREVAGLLIVLRLWRLVKLVGGIAVGAGEVEEEVIKELEDVKRQLEGTTVALAKAREENRKLRSRVVWLETGGSEGSEH